MAFSGAAEQRCLRKSEIAKSGERRALDIFSHDNRGIFAHEVGDRMIRIQDDGKRASSHQSATKRTRIMPIVFDAATIDKLKRRKQSTRDASS